MVFQQFVGINGIGFYASETFASASTFIITMQTSDTTRSDFCINTRHDHAGLASGKNGINLIACIQVQKLIVLKENFSVIKCSVRFAWKT